ncbi:zf-TFIIB domain-containing protein [Polyangium sp. 15x6]|uniref:TFIIB-type zinc ribbon-containing protein n=1 Tax=Polyangium sp. 15x6 TaxID=3042687 RepID=UPI00249AAB9D|nr:zf-TFIIB domain-containing protein [Polyangium sp. 15x6]MDI3282870.1 zf-TFIIB domain-containing protein [Polyangium sp. 15x6]
MECPRCKIEMTNDPYRGAEQRHHRRERLEAVAHAAGVEIDRCSGCDGVFLDHGELAKIQSAAAHGDTLPTHAPTTAVQRAYARARERGAAGEAEAAALVCPACGGEMAARNWGFGSEVMIDTCIECRGVWLDFGELEALEDLFR